MALSPIAPMLAVPSTGASNRPTVNLADLLATGDWATDVKVDGVRAIWTGSADGRLVSRKDEDLTHAFPEVVAQLKRRCDMVLDGEIVSMDGSFESTLSRTSQIKAAVIGRLAESNPHQFVAFDLPILGTRRDGLPAKPWAKRRSRLEALAQTRGLLITHVSYDDSLWHQTRDLGMEGVIAKRLDGRYLPGKRSELWVKFKHLHRISCLVSGFTPGQGHRSHFGAITLALIDTDGQVVPVGRCGSGFTVRQTHDLAQRLSAGEVMVAEIEATHVTSGNTLRFPVFRGVRTDVAITDCTVDQLDSLPRTGVAPSVV